MTDALIPAVRVIDIDGRSYYEHAYINTIAQRHRGEGDIFAAVRRGRIADPRGDGNTHLWATDVVDMTTAVSAADKHPVSAAQTSFHYQVHLPKPVAVKFDRDRDAGHRFVMSLLPDGIGGETRGLTDTLWRVDEGGNALDIVTAAVITGFTGTPVNPVKTGQQVRLRLALEAVRAKSSPLEPAVVSALRAEGIRWRNPRGRVDDEELSAWVESQLLKHGWTISTLKDGDTRRRVVSRRNAHMHLVEVTVGATVSDADAANSSLRLGIGRGRSFGAGLVTAI
jgi:hypothetical protein